VKYVIDAGHGGHDSGAVGQAATREADHVLSIAHHVARGLQEAGHDVELTRLADEFVELDERCAFANGINAERFISIHANAVDSSLPGGMEVWTSPGWTPADPIATSIFNAIREAFPTLRGRVDTSDGDPDKESKFYVLIHTIAPAVLVETAFISNPDEERKLADPGWRLRMAGAIVTGLLRSEV